MRATSIGKAFPSMANILILDDDPDAVVLMQRIVQRNGHTAFGFTEEEEAIAFAARNSVDLAILDIMLKKINGIEVLRELKKINPGIRAIMITGYPSVQTAREAVRLGAAEYCVKPVEIDDIQRKVEEALASGT